MVLLRGENFQVGKVVVVFVAIDVVDMEGPWQWGVVGVAELVVVELEVRTVPSGPDGESEEVVGSEVGGEGWRGGMVWCWLGLPSEGFLAPPAHPGTVHDDVKRMLVVQWNSDTMLPLLTWC